MARLIALTLGRGVTSPDDFVLGITEPTQTNTGVLSGVSRTNYAGTIDFTTPGQTFSNLNISAVQNVAGAGHTFYNCMFTYSYAGDSGGGQVMTKAASVQDTWFEHCTFKPTSPGDRYNAIYGHDFTAYRCQMEHVVDGVGIYNQFANTANVNIYGNWIGNLAWFEDDRQAAGGHSDGTHNDGVQHGSSNNVEIIGNTFYGYKYNVLGTPALDGSANNLHPQIGQIFLTQHSAYFHVGPNIVVERNFIYGGDGGIKAMNACNVSGHGDRAVVSMTVQDNLWMDDDQRSYGGANPTTPMRWDTNVTVTGTSYPTGAWYVDAHNNKYANVPAVALAKRGTNVAIKVDTVAAPDH